MAKSEALVPSREGAIIPQSDAGSAFAEYTQEREKWLSLPYAHNKTLAKLGIPFTIVAADEIDMPATELDLARGVPADTLIRKCAYMVLSQMDWTHKGEGDDKTVDYKKGEPCIILFNVNAVRSRDLDRIQSLLKLDGSIPNVCMQAYKNRRPGFAPAHGLVSAEQWRVLE